MIKKPNGRIGMLPLLVKQIKAEAARNTCGCLCVASISGQETLCSVTASVFYVLEESW